jgi:hypothetical protein
MTQPWGEPLEALPEGYAPAPEGGAHRLPPYPPWAYRVGAAEYEHRARTLVARGWRIMRPADIGDEELTFDARRDPDGYAVGDILPFPPDWPDGWLPPAFVCSPDWHRIPHAADADGFDWSTVRIDRAGGGPP